MVQPLTVRAILGFFLFASAAVVLGLSAFMQNNLRISQIAQPEITLCVVVGAITILYEVGGTIIRHTSTGALSSFGVEVAALFVIWALWLAAAAAYTVYSKDARFVCDNLNKIQSVRPVSNGPFTSGYISRNMLEDACNKIRALTAFLWIGWIFASVIMAYTLYRAFKQSHLRSLWSGKFRDGSNMITPSEPVDQRTTRPSEETYVEAGTAAPVTRPKTQV